MRKKLMLMVLMLAFLLASALSFSACNFSQFMPYDYQDGMTIFLMDNDDHFRTQFHFVTPLPSNASDTQIIQMDNFFFNTIGQYFGGGTLSRVSRGRLEANPLNTDATNAPNRFVFVFQLVRNRPDGQNYRFDSNLAPVLYAREDRGAFSGTRVVRHQNPLASIAFVDELLTNPQSPFYNHASIALNVMAQLARNRSSIEGGTRAAHAGVFYAEFRGTNEGHVSVMDISFGFMISWHWFLLAGAIAGVVVLLILLFARKGEGRLVKVNRVVAQRFGRIVTIDAAGLPVDEAAVFDELGGINNEHGNKSNDVFEGF